MYYLEKRCIQRNDFFHCISFTNFLSFDVKIFFTLSEIFTANVFRGGNFFIENYSGMISFGFFLALLLFCLKLDELIFVADNLQSVVVILRYFFLSVHLMKLENKSLNIRRFYSAYGWIIIPKVIL